MRVLEPAQETSLADHGLHCYEVRFYPTRTKVKEITGAFEDVSVLNDVSIVVVMARDAAEAVRRARARIDTSVQNV
jgi:hypothetical protein